MEAHGDGLTLLEKRAVTRLVHTEYRLEVDRFKQYVESRGKSVDRVGDAELDGLFAEYFEKTFFAGVEASRGAKTLAGWLHFHPSFNRLGSKRLPRAWRALRGW